MWCQRCYEKERDKGERGKIIKKQYLNEMVKKIEALMLEVLLIGLLNAIKLGF